MKKKVTKPQVVRIPLGDGKFKKIGELYTDTKLFTVTQSRSKDYNPYLNGWGIDKKVLELLIKLEVSIELKDSESKWKFKSQAIDFRLYGTEKDIKGSRPKVFLHIDKWEVIRANNRSYICKCDCLECENNFARNCLRGAMNINREGMCANYVPR